MTVTQAEAICSLVPDVVASKGGSGFCSRSQLGNWTLVEISNAFALVIAKNRQAVDGDPNGRRLCREYAEKAASIMVSLRMIVISDADAERLSKIPRETAEYEEARRKLVIHLLEDRSPEWQKFLKLEGLDSFNSYCWSLDPADAKYWEKIHTRLRLPMEEPSKERKEPLPAAQKPQRPVVKVTAPTRVPQ